MIVYLVYPFIPPSFSQETPSQSLSVHFSPLQFYFSLPINPTRTPSSSSLLLLSLIPLSNSVKSTTRICNIKIITINCRSHSLPSRFPELPLALPLPILPPPPTHTSLPSHTIIIPKPSMTCHMVTS